MRFKEYLPLLLWSIGSYTAIVVLMVKPTRDNTEAFLAPPPEYIEYMHFGFSSSLADSFWLRWIQDGDRCQFYFGKVQELEATPDIKSAMAKDITFNPRHKMCDNSWGFKMLDAVTKLDSRFKMPYLAGTMSLSVLVEDYEGATALFERGLTVYPDDWSLNYRAAYHFLFDKKDVARAAQLLTHSAEVGGPDWLRSLAARLYTQAGQIELGLAALLNYRKAFENSSNPKGLAELDKRIADLEAALAKERTKK